MLLTRPNKLKDTNVSDNYESSTLRQTHDEFLFRDWRSRNKRASFSYFNSLLSWEMPWSASNLLKTGRSLQQGAFDGVERTEHGYPTSRSADS